MKRAQHGFFFSSEPWRVLIFRPAWLVASTALAAIVAGCWPAAAWAQAAAQIPLQFDYMSPGARSLGMGGAFIGASDDASTAYANPAGLTRISTREISLECRYRGLETAFLQGGRLSGTPTGIGADTISGPSYSTDTDRSWAPGFMSFVLPMGGATMGFYRHESVSVDTSFSYMGAFQQVTSGGVTNDSARDLALAGERQMTVRTYGGAVGGRLSDRIGIGGGLALYTFDLESKVSRYGFEPTVYGPVNWDSPTAASLLDGEDVSWGANLGVLVTLSSDISIGAQWRRGSTFQLSNEYQPSSTAAAIRRDASFRMPAVAGAGLQWHLSSNLRVVADYDWVQYSVIRRDFIDLESVSSIRQDQLRADDSHEIHGGMEYLVLSTSKPLAFRAGAWIDPDHTVWYDGSGTSDAAGELLSAALPRGDTVVHYTGGFGIALSGKSEINIGLDVSSRSSYMTASGVIRF